MVYDYFIPIIEELNLIQRTAQKYKPRKSKLRNDSEIKNLIQINGYRYEEDFMDDDILKELNDLNNFSDFDDILDELENEKFICKTNYSNEKELVQTSVTNALFDYQYIYKIIGVDIKPRDWDFLFDVMFHFYKDNDIGELFLDDMAKLNRLAISLSLLRSSLININCYIEGLGYLESSYLGEKDIIMLQDKLKEKTDFKRVINFNDSSKKNKKMVKSMNLGKTKIIDFNSYKKQNS